MTTLRLLGASLIVFCIAGFHAGSVFQPAPPVTIYVSPAGNDQNPGTASLPIATLGHARKLVRAIDRDMTANISVVLESGTYRLNGPLVLEPQDSGTNGHTISWRAAQGADPIVTGARRIVGWSEVDPASDIWAAHPLTLPQTRQLYVNGDRAELASGPLPTRLRRVPLGYRAATDVMDSWPNSSEIEFVYSQQLGQMSEPMCPVNAITGTLIRMAEPCWQNSTRRVIRHVSRAYDANLVGYGAINIPTYIEDAYELLTQSGQFYIDDSSRTVYYIPRPGQNMTTADVEAPVLQRLVQVNGSPSAPVQNVNFVGIQFSYATWLQPSSPNGFSEIQSGYTLTGTDAYAHEGLCGLVPHGQCPYGAWTKEPGAVQVALDRNVSFSDDEFVHLGGAGLNFDNGSLNDSVNHCVFTDISGNGLEIGDVNRPAAKPAFQTRSVDVRDSHIYAIGAEFPGATAILIGYAADSVISHNQIDHIPYTAISAGWGGWLDKVQHAPVANFSHGNTIANNLIFDYMQTLSDGGGIYTQGQTGGSLRGGEHVIGNVVHDQLDWAIALHSDNGASFVSYAGNVLYNNTYDWGSNRHDYADGNGGANQAPFNPQAVVGNYWQQPYAQDTRGGFVERGNTVIEAVSEAPRTVVSAAGIPVSNSQVTSWQPAGMSAPTPPNHVAVLYTSGSKAYITWHPSLPGDNDPVTSYTIAPCLIATGTATSTCNGAGPLAVTVTLAAYNAMGYAVVDGLVAHSRYTFEVTANGPSGSSGPSLPSSVTGAGVHPGQRPGEPATVFGTWSRNGLAVVWQPPSSDKAEARHSLVSCVGPWWTATCTNPTLAYVLTISRLTPSGKVIGQPITRVAGGLSVLIVTNGGGHGVYVATGLDQGRYVVSVSAESPAGIGPKTTSAPVVVG